MREGGRGGEREREGEEVNERERGECGGKEERAY